MLRDFPDRLNIVAHFERCQVVATSGRGRSSADTAVLCRVQLVVEVHEVVELLKLFITHLSKRQRGYVLMAFRWSVTGKLLFQLIKKLSCRRASGF